MNCHLSRELSWTPLVEMYAVSKAQTDPRTYTVPDEFNWRYYYYMYKPRPQRFERPVKQFALDLLRLLNEFRATDNSTPEVMKRYDPKVWGERGLRADFMPTHNPRLGYYESLLWGYMTLNLLIADPERMPPVVIPTKYLSMPLQCMLGWDYEAHPEHLSTHLRQAFEGSRLKPLAPEVLKILRDHAAMMFRCMYSVTGENKLLDEDRLTRLVLEFFEWHAPEE